MNSEKSHFKVNKDFDLCPTRQVYRRQNSVNNDFDYDLVRRSLLRKRGSSIVRNRGKQPCIFDLKKYIIVIVPFIILSFCIIKFFGKYWSPTSLKSQIDSLKNEFSTQNNETWRSIFSALEKSDGSTKSLLLLHGDDEKTCNCLKNRLASIHQTKSSVAKEYLTFNVLDQNATDYGVILQRYRSLIKKHKVLVVNLDEISSSVARMFHFLCDEIYTDDNPPLVIFTLRDTEDEYNLRPLSKAGGILKKKWKDLPENEINPLISRIVRNVVAVTREKNNFICAGSETLT